MLCKLDLLLGLGGLGAGLNRLAVVGLQLLQLLLWELGLLGLGWKVISKCQTVNATASLPSSSAARFRFFFSALVSFLGSGFFCSWFSGISLVAEIIEVGSVMDNWQENHSRSTSASYLMMILIMAALRREVVEGNCNQEFTESRQRSNKTVMRVRISRALLEMVDILKVKGGRLKFREKISQVRDDSWINSLCLLGKGESRDMVVAI
jgi:hypothetical protein